MAPETMPQIQPGRYSGAIRRKRCFGHEQRGTFVEQDADPLWALLMAGTAAANSDVNLMFAALIRLAEGRRALNRKGRMVQWLVRRSVQLASRKVVRDEISRTSRRVSVPGVNWASAIKQGRTLQVGVI
jgi:hypothetical protein